MCEVRAQKERRIVRATLAETTREDKFNTWMTRNHSFPVQRVEQTPEEP